ncbi:branched-chain amino acid ABC transporter permease [Aquabacter spiritensis]|uniref:Amino acid/amide ABC transporter membrane protein 1 (HAAT family) n=1 Tax=Aquabacter spiritensis TaxID=933073 RepID=A0A4R3M2N8_9HYPH|nr:branched-chain amino acid ABC transporter permease [Aquabacter spiritensis]TCT05507.1 amino acid/amide ABC transporter membrane protein 1 (HAAT family) [Aquabacter spiritensis]
MIYDQFLQTLLGGLAIGCIYSLIALGISMIVRATDILHFAQGEVMMVGAMTGFSSGVWAGNAPLLALIGGTFGGGLMAVAVELGVYRPLRARRVPLINVVIATIGVSIVLQNVARLVWGSEPLAYPALFETRGLVISGFTVSPQLATIVVLSVLIMAALAVFFRYSRAGIAMQAAAQDPDAARLMGISVERATVNTFAVSGMMAGAAGVLLGSLFFASFNMGFITGIKAFVAAVLGGLGSVPGAMVGGLLFGVIETFSAMFISTSYKDAVGMVVLILILLVAPMGLFGRAGRQV